MKNKKKLLMIIGVVIAFIFLKSGGFMLITKGILLLLKWALLLYVAIACLSFLYRWIGKPVLIIAGIGWLLMMLSSIF